MRVLFVSEPHGRELPRGEEYVVGQVYDLVAHKAHKWIDLGRAELAPPEPIPHSADILAEAVGGEIAEAAGGDPAAKPQGKARRGKAAADDADG